MTRFLRNILSNWTGMAVSMAVAFFMSPFLVHSLGDRQYGLWVLILSVTGYMGLLDIGLRVSVVKYVSQLVTLGDFEGLNRVISTALAFYGAVALLIMLVTVGIEAFFHSVFSLSPEDVETARLVLLLAGANVAATLVMSIPGGVLAGLQRYDLASAAGIATVLVRSALIAALVLRGYGIVALASVHLGSQLLFGGLAWVAARRVCHQIALSPSYVSIGTGRMLWGYSAFVLVNNAGRFLLFSSGEIVVGVFLGTASVTYYAIAGTIAQYMQQIVATMAQVLHPYAAAQHARGGQGALKNAAILGTRMSLLVGVPITVTVLIVGFHFIGLWMGESYAAVAGPLLLLLTLARLVHLSQAGSYEVLLGMSRHRFPTVLNFVTGIAAVGAAMLLTPAYGLAGVAAGGALPIFVAHGLVMPWYVTRVLQVSWLAYVREAVWPPLAATVPYAALLAAAMYVAPPRSLPALAAIVLAALPIFAVTAFFTCLDVHERQAVTGLLRRRTRSAPPAPLAGGEPLRTDVSNAPASR